MSEQLSDRLSIAELEAEGGTSLPAKEVFSPILDLTLDLDLALDLAAPIDLAVAANANVAAPIDAAVAANVLSLTSTSAALADQDVLIQQHLSGEAHAEAPQTATVDQSNDTVDAGGTETVGEPTTVEDALDAPLLNVDVNAAIDADLAAPIAGAVAANANVAAPIDAAVSANALSPNAVSVADASQDALIVQTLAGDANATSNQNSAIMQGEEGGEANSSADSQTGVDESQS
jgi:hypothetical protein